LPVDVSVSAAKSEPPTPRSRALSHPEISEFQDVNRKNI
jgi:hypothetical protein